MNNKLIYSICLIIGLICLSCAKRETYYHFQGLQDAKWSKNDTLYFYIDSSVVVVNKPMDIQIEMVNDSDYPYQNIWLYIEDDFSNNHTERTEKQYQLADQMGKWNGSGFGSLFQLTLNYKTKVMFPEKRNYQLKIVQGMRDEPLKGIEKIGLKLIQSE